MNLSKILLPLSILFIFLAGCNNSGNPTPKDYLKNADADIFLLDGIVYANVQDFKWVTELEYKLGDQIGEITKQTDKAIFFKNGTASKLPVGTKIYAAIGTPAYIVIVNGKEIPYLGMYEG